MVAPVLVLDVDRPARILLLELLVGRRNDIRPARLCVDLKPDRERLGLGRWPLLALAVAATTPSATTSEGRHENS